MLPSGRGDELAIAGAIRLQGKKERLADWLRNIQHFRDSAQLGVTRVVQSPPSAAAFADAALDSSDLAELRQCSAQQCAIRLSAEALQGFQRDVAWGSADAAAQANEVLRQMLLGYTDAYLKSGHAGVAAYDGPQARRSFVDDMHLLIQRATTLTELAPELLTYLDRFPSATLAAGDQLLYWSAMPAGSNTMMSVHHLVVYRPAASEVWIADKTIYATRYLDAGVLAIRLYDTSGGYYVVAGSRVKASQLGGVAARVLRRQVERSATDTVKTYLEWVRDSLAQAGKDSELTAPVTARRASARLLWLRLGMLAGLQQRRERGLA